MDNGYRTNADDMPADTMICMYWAVVPCQNKIILKNFRPVGRPCWNIFFSMEPRLKLFKKFYFNIESPLKLF